MKKIPVKFTLVDDEDYEVLTQYNWMCNSYGYAVRRFRSGEGPRSGTCHLSRFILKCPKGMEVDHINGNPLDNRRCNLRIVTRAQNCMNKAAEGVGYRKDKKKWRARIKLDGKETFLGHYDTKEEARAVYIAATQMYFGDYARAV